jgi:nematocidal protein AidA
MEILFQASAQNINILIVIDTEYVKKTHPKQTNPNMQQPAGIDHSGQFMLCTGSRGIISGQGTGDLNFRANPGDFVQFTGVSIYENSDDAVIVYNITKYGGTDVFNQFVPNVITRKNAVAPDPATENGLPAIHTQLNFNSFDSKVRNGGTENFNVAFALYTLDDDGETQSLYGYFYWDPTITVS